MFCMMSGKIERRVIVALGLLMLMNLLRSYQMGMTHTLVDVELCFLEGNVSELP